MIPLLHVVLSLSLLSRILPTTLAQKNVTVDDTDPSITYAPPGAWVLSSPDSLDFGGAHMLTQNPNATATFMFTGIAIYFFSPKWPYSVSTQLTLDGGAPVLIDLVDHSRPNTVVGPETVQSAVVWNATGLNNTAHTLVVSVGAGQPFGVVDGIIFTEAANTTTDTATTTTTPAPSSTSTTQTSQTTSSSTNTDVPSTVPPPEPQTVSASKKIRVAPIVLGALFGLLGLFIVGLSIYYAFKRRRRPESEAWTDGGAGGGYAAGGAYSVVGSVRGAVYPMTQSASGTWQNPCYGYVGGTLPAPPTVPASYGDPADARAPNRYVPGMTLSTITEKSTPRLGAAGASLAASPESGLSKDLPSGYWTAPSSDVSSGATRVVGGRGLPGYSVQALHVPGAGADRARSGWV